MKSGLSSSSTLCSLTKAFTIHFSDNGSLSCILYGNNKLSWQIFHAVLVAISLCCAKHCKFFLDFMLPPPLLHWKLLLFKQMCYVYVPLHIYHTHFLFFQLVNKPVGSVSQCCNMNRKLSMIISLHSNTRTTRRVISSHKHFMILHIWPHLVT
jgi:hypothetical protein